MPETAIDVAGATEALNAAGGFSALQAQDQDTASGPDQSAVAPTPSEESPADGTTPRLPSTEAALAAASQPEPETGQDTILPRADLDALLAGVDDPVARERIETAYKSFQGASTKKFQEVAELRKQYEGLGDPTQIQAALELQNALQDPRAWQSLHAELTEGLRAMGMSPAEAHAEATAQLNDAATGGDELPDLSALEDPELSPLKSYIESLKGEVDGIRKEMADAREQDRLAQVQMAMSGELQRQENIIREARPDLQDDDITTIWEMSAFYDGNLLEANKQLDAYAQRRFEQYLASKGTPAAGSQTVLTPVPGGDITTESPKAAPASLDDAHKLAVERLRFLEEQG